MLKQNVARHTQDNRANASAQHAQSAQTTAAASTQGQPAMAAATDAAQNGTGNPAHLSTALAAVGDATHVQHTETHGGSSVGRDDVGESHLNTRAAECGDMQIHPPTVATCNHADVTTPMLNGSAKAASQDAAASAATHDSSRMESVRLTNSTSTMPPTALLASPEGVDQPGHADADSTAQPCSMAARATAVHSVGDNSCAHASAANDRPAAMSGSGVLQNMGLAAGAADAAPAHAAACPAKDTAGLTACPAGKTPAATCAAQIMVLVDATSSRTGHDAQPQGASPEVAADTCLTEAPGGRATAHELAADAKATACNISGASEHGPTQRSDALPLEPAAQHPENSSGTRRGRTVASMPKTGRKGSVLPCFCMEATATK